MSVNSPPKNPPVSGYLDRLSVRPGERLAVKVSIDGGGDYDASVVRIRHGDPNPAGPGMRLEDIPLSGFPKRMPARKQEVELGSYALVHPHKCLTAPRLVVSVLMQPWLLKESPGSLVSCRDPSGAGWALNATDGEIRFDYLSAGGASHSIALPVRLKRRQWYRVWAGYDVDAGRLVIGWAGPDGGRGDAVEASAALKRLPVPGHLTFGAAVTAGRSASHYNGRLEDPALSVSWPQGRSAPPLPEEDPGLVAWWDFSLAMDTQSIIDQGPSGLNGHLVNVPARAVRGSRWTGEEMCWRHAPRHYAAIHFHEDDLYDCRWQTDFEIAIPPDLKSGVYGVRLRYGADEDVIPFYVLPPRGRATARVCFLAPTFTYQAYANHARGNLDDAMRERIRSWGAARYNPDEYRAFGSSTYNFHPDGSGHAYSSRLRPILTFRPGFLTFVDDRGSGLRHFPADTHLLDWLEARGIGYDVVTDEDLHAEGVGLVDSYAVILTGSHPEYHTKESLEALIAYTDRGGKLVYLGGNGFYWRIAQTSRLPGMIEVRRSEGGIRAWAAEPGEAYHALDGAYGGLWRRNGHPPQQLVGIGFSAQGLFEGSHYRRLPASFDPACAWIFEGVTEEKLGGYGLSGGGAAGFELDRADVELGTPENTVVLARSEGHGDSYIVVPEELLTHVRTVSGEPRDALVRGEITYFEKPGGGAVFSVGSITFCGSLSHDRYRNGISRMLENVVRRFAAPGAGHDDGEPEPDLKEFAR
jgi:N,N-dimethylformamidase